MRQSPAGDRAASAQFTALHRGPACLSSSNRAPLLRCAKGGPPGPRFRPPPLEGMGHPATRLSALDALATLRATRNSEPPQRVPTSSAPRCPTLNEVGEHAPVVYEARQDKQPTQSRRGDDPKVDGGKWSVYFQVYPALPELRFGVVVKSETTPHVADRQIHQRVLRNVTERVLNEQRRPPRRRADACPKHKQREETATKAGQTPAHATTPPSRCGDRFVRFVRRV